MKNILTKRILATHQKAISPNSDGHNNLPSDPVDNRLTYDDKWQLIDVLWELIDKGSMQWKGDVNDLLFALESRAPEDLKKKIMPIKSLPANGDSFLKQLVGFEEHLSATKIDMTKKEIAHRSIIRIRMRSEWETF